MFDPDDIKWDAVWYIEGECASKSNSRRLVRGADGQLRSVKSHKAMNFAHAIKLQCKPLPKLLTGNLLLCCDVWYPSRRNDLDLSLVEDGLQGIAYKNDRQIVMNIGRKFLDRKHPRVIARVKRLTEQIIPPDHFVRPPLDKRVGDVNPEKIIKPRGKGDVPF